MGRAHRARCRGEIGVATLALLAPATARAHPGLPPAPHDLWTSWSFEPVVLLGLVVLAGGYALGVRRLWRRAGRGRGIARWRVRAFAAGVLALVVALVSPLDALGLSLFSGHMVQHLALMLVAAPLLVAGLPERAFLHAIPRPMAHAFGRGWHRLGLRRLGRAVVHPVSVGAMHAAAIWAWHVPRLYDTAIHFERWHAAEHASFLVTAALFWALLDQPGRRARLAALPAMLLVFVTAMQSTVLGALLTLSSHPWYSAHLPFTAAWGLTPLEDQQLAGVLMWVPAGTFYLPALVWVLWRALRGAEAKSPMRAAAAPGT
ncbi:MAG TPA: cytochrome c oxidase assembly protein [Gemmatimonadaceae bacterium]|jgi:putative membrane protein|nr:cytochrome c oxidase assembly protein [Gemmatimonadaceae bacterium]